MEAGTLCYVKAENVFYSWSGTEWGFYCDNLQAYNTWQINNLAHFMFGDGSYYFPAGDPEQISCKVAPMPMNKNKNLPLNVAMVDNYLLTPYSGIGVSCDQCLQITRPVNLSSSDGNDFLGTFSVYNVPPISIMPHVCNWIGFQKAGSDLVLLGVGVTGDTYPCGSVSGYCIDGTEVDVYSLAWSTPPDKKSIYWNFYEKWVNVLQNSIIVDQELLLDAKDFSQFDPNGTIIKKDGQAFIAQKAELNSPLPQVSTITMVRI